MAPVHPEEPHAVHAGNAQAADHAQGQREWRLPAWLRSGMTIWPPTYLPACSRACLRAWCCNGAAGRAADTACLEGCLRLHGAAWRTLPLAGSLAANSALGCCAVEADLFCPCPPPRPGRCRAPRSWCGCRRHHATKRRSSGPSCHQSGSASTTAWRRWVGGWPGGKHAVVNTRSCLPVRGLGAGVVQLPPSCCTCSPAHFLTLGLIASALAPQDIGFYRPEGPAFHLDLFQIGIGEWRGQVLS